MRSVQHLNNLHKKEQSGSSASSLFFGTILKIFPEITIGDFGAINATKFLKKVFQEHFVPFLKELWVTLHTDSLHPFRLVYLEDEQVYVPKSVDKCLGQFFCLYDKLVTLKKEYIFHWYEPNIYHTNMNELRYDPTVAFLEVGSSPNLSEDNIMEWSIFISNIVNNGPHTKEPEPLISPFNTPFSKILEEDFFIQRLKNASITTEEGKSITDTIWENDIPMENERMGNFIRCYGELGGDKDEILKNVEVQKFYKANKNNKELKKANISLSSVENLDETIYTYDNADLDNIQSLSQLWNGKKLTHADLMSALEQALLDGVGILTDPILKGRTRHIIAPPGRKPIIIPKYDGASNLMPALQRHDSIVDNTVGIKFLNSSNGKMAADTIRLNFEITKQKFFSDQQVLESCLNIVYKMVMVGDLKVIKSFVEEFGKISFDIHDFEVNFHFQQIYTQDLSQIVELYEKGIFDLKTTQKDVLQQRGKFDETSSQPNNNKPDVKSDMKSVKESKTKSVEDEAIDITESPPEESRIETGTEKKTTKKSEGIQKKKEEKKHPRSDDEDEDSSKKKKKEGEKKEKREKGKMEKEKRPTDKKEKKD